MSQIESAAGKRIAPLLRPPRRDLHKPRLIAPAGACDTHFHIYFPETVYPLRPDRRYTPVAAGLEDYLAIFRALGLSRGVVVNGAANADNRPTLEAVRRMNGAFKGLALVGAEVSDAELRRLTDGGMTGFRMSTVSVGGLSPRHLAPMARRVADLGWHVEVHMHTAEDFLALIPVLKALPIPYALDRIANLSPHVGSGTATFEAIRALLAEDPKCYVNLYGLYLLSASGPPRYEDMVPVARALIAARPEGIIWGSNWPHPSFEVPLPDDADLLDFLLEAAPHSQHRKLILADNPARLYGWGQP
jgi:predicted TIM-barrel fold metal-dependent hydrolase